MIACEYVYVKQKNEKVIYFCYGFSIGMHEEVFLITLRCKKNMLKRRIKFQKNNQRSKYIISREGYSV